GAVRGVQVRRRRRLRFSCLALRAEFAEAWLTERVEEQPGCFATEVSNERGCSRPLWVGGVGLGRQRGLSRGRCRGGGEGVCRALDDGCGLAACRREGAGDDVEHGGEEWPVAH